MHTARFLSSLYCVFASCCSPATGPFYAQRVSVCPTYRHQATGDASHLYLSRRKVTLVSQWARLRHLPDNLVKGMQVGAAGAGVREDGAWVTGAGLVGGEGEKAHFVGLSRAE